MGGCSVVTKKACQTAGWWGGVGVRVEGGSMV